MDEAKRRIEALKVARQLLNEEYIARRAEDYNKWLLDSQVAWQTQGIRLSPPGGVVLYPTEQEIVAKALEYYNFTTAGGRGTDFKNIPPPEPVAAAAEVILPKEEIKPKEKPHADALIKDIPEPVDADEPKFTTLSTAPTTSNTVPVTTATLPAEELNETIEHIPTTGTTTLGTPAPGTDTSASSDNASVQTFGPAPKESELIKAIPPELKPLFANAPASLPPSITSPIRVPDWLKKLQQPKAL